MRLTAFVFFLLVLGACSEEKKTLPGYSGNVGEVLVVCSEDTWEGPVGSALHQYFAGVLYGLPQDEPAFDLIHFRKEKFKSIVEGHRNIVYITIASNEKETSFALQKNRFSRGQLFLDLRSNHQDSLAAFIRTKGDMLAQKFKDTEINRLFTRNSKFGDKELKTKIKTQLRLDISLQKDMYIEEIDSNFVWLRLERERSKGAYKHQISQGLLLFTAEYKAREDFKESHLLQRCDSLLKEKLPGPSDSSYMQIVKDPVAPLSRELNFRGHYAREIRGLWYMENNFMGGPFVMLASLDENTERIVLAYAYVFAPGFDKREYLREVEAMLMSLDFKP